MKHVNILLACLFASNVFAQVHKKQIAQKSPVAKPIQKAVEYTLLKGHIDNYTDKTLNYYADNYLGGFSGTIDVNSDGSFVTKIPLDVAYRTVALFPGDDRIPILFIGKDTIDVSWDQKATEKTTRIHTAVPALGDELMEYIVLDRNHVKHKNDISNKMRDTTITDSAKFAMINKAYNEDMEKVFAKPITDASAKHAIDVYFDYANLLSNGDILDSYQLELKNKPASNSRLWNIVGNKRYPPYKNENDWFFKVSDVYRRFIFDYVRFNFAFNTSTFSGDSQLGQEATQPWAPAIKDYYLGMAAFRITAMRDWFITKSVINDFSHYSFNDAIWVYKTYLPQIKTAYYADTLKKYYAQIQSLKPGGPAPIFKLKDENGKNVSLNDFRGKNVYIDFWGVGCGPCIYDIKNNVPKLHEKYKDKDVVFINICVDANEAEWKENLKKLNLHGVNLLAEGWIKSPVCKAYNVNAIPHYYLVNKFGQIVDNNSKNPGMGIDADIDKLLKQ